MSRSRAFGVLLLPLLALGVPAPAVAAPPLAASPLAAPPPAAAAPQYLETDRETRPVAPGVSLTSFDRWDAAGWLRADALTADLGGGARADYLYSGAVSRPEPLTGAATRQRAVAAVNGDFFDINASGAASHWCRRAGACSLR